MSKVSIERITKIVRLIRKRGSASMSFLIDELEVSQASIKRDFDFLRDRLGCQRADTARETRLRRRRAPPLNARLASLWLRSDIWAPSSTSI